MAETSISIRRAQRALLDAASELQDLDGRLAVLANRIVPRAGELLAAELRGGAQCVRNDLLHDAIETLRALGEASEEDVARRRRQVEMAAEQVAAFG